MVLGVQIELWIEARVRIDNLGSLLPKWLGVLRFGLLVWMTEECREIGGLKIRPRLPF
jgi:hypothetical protein